MAIVVDFQPLAWLFKLRRLLLGSVSGHSPSDVQCTMCKTWRTRRRGDEFLLQHKPANLTARLTLMHCSSESWEVSVGEKKCVQRRWQKSEKDAAVQKKSRRKNPNANCQMNEFPDMCNNIATQSDKTCSVWRWSPLPARLIRLKTMFISLQTSVIACLGLALTPKNPSPSAPKTAYEQCMQWLHKQPKTISHPGSVNRFNWAWTKGARLAATSINDLCMCMPSCIFTCHFRFHILFFVLFFFFFCFFIWRSAHAHIRRTVCDRIQ